MKALNITVDEDMHREFKIAAAMRRHTLRAATRVAIVEYIKAAKRAEKRGQNDSDALPNASQSAG